MKEMYQLLYGAVLAMGSHVLSVLTQEDVWMHTPTSLTTCYIGWWYALQLLLVLSVSYYCSSTSMLVAPTLVQLLVMHFILLLWC